jgi:hypothetical protein
MLKSLIVATVLLPTLAAAQRSQQLPQPRQPGQWCPLPLSGRSLLLPQCRHAFQERFGGLLKL